MQKLAIGMQARKVEGFTLIELLVVIIIIGITINFAILSFGDFGERRKVANAAEHFVYFMSLVKKEAILTNQTLAINIKKNNYSVLRLNNNKWETIPNNIYKNQKLPNDTSMILAKQTNKRHNAKPNIIIINSSGTITPFQLSFGKNQTKIIATVYCDRVGNIKVQKNEK